VRRINAAGFDLIKKHEGLSLTAYKDQVGVWTIFYGHTSRAGPPTVTPGMKGSQYEAEQVLASDLAKFETAVQSLVKVPLTDNQFAALVSFCFNLGSDALARSTLLKFLHVGDYTEAQAQFAKWNKAGNPPRVLPGLTKRRAAEAALFASQGLSRAQGTAPPPYLPPDAEGWPYKPAATPCAWFARTFGRRG